MVMQAAADFLVGSSNPGPANMAAAPAPASTADLKLCSRVRYHSTGVGCDSMLDVPPHCLEPSQRKLLTPPQPSKK